MSSSVPSCRGLFRCVGPGDSDDVSVADHGCSGEWEVVLLVNVVVIEVVKVAVVMSTCQYESESGCLNLDKECSDSGDESNSR